MEGLHTLMLIGGISVSIIYEQFKGFFQLPKEINKLFDVYTIKSKDRRGVYWKEQIFHSVKDFTINLEQKLDEIIESIEQKELLESSKNFNQIVEKIKENLENVNENLTKIGESLLLENINPEVYFIAKKHYLLSKIFLDKISENSEKIIKFLKSSTTKSLREVLRENKEYFKLGVIIGIEPLLVVTSIMAGIRRDYKFLSKYSQLVNESSFMTFRIFREEYLKETGVLKTIYGKQAYLKFLSLLEKERENESIL